MDNFNADLLTVIGVLVGLSALLFGLSALDPTTERRPGSAQQSRPSAPDPRLQAVADPVAAE